MRYYRTGICGVAAFALLAGCSGNVASPSGSPLSAADAASWHGGAIGAPLSRHSDGRLHGLPAPQTAKDGIYVSEFSRQKRCWISKKARKEARAVLHGSVDFVGR